MRTIRKIEGALILAATLAHGNAMAGQFTARDGGPGHGEMIAVPSADSGSDGVVGLNRAITIASFGDLVAEADIA